MTSSRAPFRQDGPSGAAAILQIYDGWAGLRHFFNFIDLLDTLLTNSYERPEEWGGLEVADFLAGLGHDPMDLRGRGMRRREVQAHTKAVAIARQEARFPIYHRSENPDILGPIYTRLIGQGDLPQFSTPFHVSLLTAQLSVADIEGQLLRRLRDASHIAGLPPWGVGDWAGTPVISYLHRFAEPVMARYDPITIVEPSVGSGGMLLAVASLVPLWALAYGAIRLTGIDLDPRAVQMTRIHCFLYGVPVQLGCGNQLPEAVEAGLKEPYGSSYRAIRGALANGFPEEANAIAASLIGYVPKFPNVEAPSDAAL